MFSADCCTSRCPVAIPLRREHRVQIVEIAGPLLERAPRAGRIAGAQLLERLLGLLSCPRGTLPSSPPPARAASCREWLPLLRVRLAIDQRSRGLAYRTIRGRPR